MWAENMGELESIGGAFGGLSEISDLYGMGSAADEGGVHDFWGLAPGTEVTSRATHMGGDVPPVGSGAPMDSTDFWEMQADLISLAPTDDSDGLFRQNGAQSSSSSSEPAVIGASCKRGGVVIETHGEGAARTRWVRPLGPRVSHARTTKPAPGAWVRKQLPITIKVEGGASSSSSKQSPRPSRGEGGAKAKASGAGGVAGSKAGLSKGIGKAQREDLRDISKEISKVEMLRVFSEGSEMMSDDAIEQAPSASLATPI